MKYQANPVTVEAHVIQGVGEHVNGGRRLLLNDGSDKGIEVIATHQMLARIEPKVGDYWVIQEDGYIYLNPKDVFERKYSIIESDVDDESATADETSRVVNAEPIECEPTEPAITAPEPIVEPVVEGEPISKE